VLPEPGKSAVYRHKYGKYTALCEALDTVWDRFEV
jgi:hypothetical protein